VFIEPNRRDQICQTGKFSTRANAADALALDDADRHRARRCEILDGAGFLFGAFRSMGNVDSERVGDEWPNSAGTKASKVFLGVWRILIEWSKLGSHLATAS
jgi:hypothetical protein